MARVPRILSSVSTILNNLISALLSVFAISPSLPKIWEIAQFFDDSLVLMDLGPSSKNKDFILYKITRILFCSHSGFFSTDFRRMSGWIQMPDGHPGALGSATSEREQAQSLKDAAAKVHMHTQCACVLVIKFFSFLNYCVKYWRRNSFNIFQINLQFF